MKFNFTHVEELTSGDDLIDLFTNLPRLLEKLDISFENCENLTTLNGLEALEGLPLRKLSMHFTGCTQLRRQRSITELEGGTG